MGGDAVFRLAVHLLGADLHLKGDALGADDHRVQGLVAVGLGGADIVLEAAGHRLVQVVDHAQHVVAVGQLLDDDPGGADVIQLRKAEVLSVQLPVDAVDALEPGLYLALDAGLLQLFGNAGLGQVQKVREAVVLLLQIVRNLLVAHRVQDLQRPVLQLPLDPLHTQPVGQGGVDLHGLHGDVPLLLLPLELDGAHIVQAVGQLDHDDPDVLRHGDEHLAQVLHLLLFLGGITGVLHLSQLGDAVHQNGHRLAEFLCHLVIAGVGVLDGVVKQASHDGLRVQAHLLNDHRHRHRMHDIGLTALAQLPLMMPAGIVIGAEDVFSLLFGEVRRDIPHLPVQFFQIFLSFTLVHRISPSILPSVF